MQGQTYFEIHVPLSNGDTWLYSLKDALRQHRVRWQNGYYHFTVAFLYSHPVDLDVVSILRRHCIQQIIPSLTLDRLDAFTTRDGSTHIINLTCSQVPESFKSWVLSVRQDLIDHGCNVDTGFKFHITLGRLDASTIDITTLRQLMSHVQAPAVPFVPQFAEYREYRGDSIFKWELQKMLSMTQSYPTEIIRDHLFIKDDRGEMVLVDTGSPYSFHASGLLTISGQTFSTHRSLLSVNSSFLSDKLNIPVGGLLGMDIMQQHETWIDLKNENMNFFPSGTTPLCLFPGGTRSIGGCLAVNLLVEGNDYWMILDTGAPISYISSFATINHDPCGHAMDFLPSLDHQTFETDLFELSTALCFNHDWPTLKIKYGNLPVNVERQLSIMGVEGIIGMDFFKKLRIVFCGDNVYLPPQGI